MKAVRFALLMVTGCVPVHDYQGPERTIIAAAHVQWSYQHHKEAFRCTATVERIAPDRFAVRCGERLTYVRCSWWCCTALGDREGRVEIEGENPKVCDDRPH
jgi:hypothetical protein